MRELDLAGNGVISEYLHATAVVCEPEVVVAIVIVVEEQGCESLTGWFTYSFAGRVNEVGVVTGNGFASDRVRPGDGFAEGVAHQDWPVYQSCALGDVRESAIAVVVIEHVVMPVMVRPVKP